MDEKRAARRRLQLRRAYLSTARDMDIVAEIERAEFLAGIMIAVAFGICLLIGIGVVA